jgi:murein DD-endopeptidase MepM/ murein hydrolase activator NlpD
MFKGQPQFGLPAFPNFFTSLKIVLGVFLLTFLSGYQPTLGFPPVKQNVALAQTQPAQEVQINAQISTQQFQLMFPGYLSQGYSNYHQALDIATGLGMPIKPITTGKVTYAGYDFWGYGLKVEIDHGNGYKSLYAHLGKIYVSEGQDISANNYIGEVGMTGRTSGPHTHLEVTKEGKMIDARAILPDIRLYAEEKDFQALGGKGFNNPLKSEQKASNKAKLQVQENSSEIKIEQSALNLVHPLIVEIKKEAPKEDLLNLKLTP